MSGQNGVLSDFSARLDHVCVASSDVDKSIRWYGNVLGLRHEYKDDPSFGKDPAFLRIGSVSVAILPLDGEQSPVKDHNGAHFAIGVNRDQFFHIRAALPDLLVRFAECDEQDTSIDEQDYGLQLSLFFSDPDRNIVEITTWVDRSDEGRL